MGEHKKKREIPLRNLVETRRFLARITNEVYAGTLDEKKGGRLAYMGNILLKSQELEIIERRLDSLEQAAELKAALDVTPVQKKLLKGE
jgi:hypothetical protein